MIHVTTPVPALTCFGSTGNAQVSCSLEKAFMLVLAVETGLGTGLAPPGTGHLLQHCSPVLRRGKATAGLRLCHLFLNHTGTGIHIQTGKSRLSQQRVPAQQAGHNHSTPSPCPAGCAIHTLGDETPRQNAYTYFVLLGG